MTYILPEEQEFAEVVSDNKLKDNLNFKMNKIKSFLSWFVFSSMNNGNISLTVKGLVPFLVLLGISDTETLNELTGVIGNLIVVIGQAIAGIITAWGILRKIWLTMKHSV